jgi:peptidoglycan/LPS O-acetylase OafA/YrhL
MTAITIETARTDQATKARPASARQLWRTGIVAGLAASVATAAGAAVAHALDVSLKVGGQAIPLLGFAQMTLAGAIIGTILAVVLSRRAERPRRTFLTTTVVLVAASFVPDVIADAPGSTRLVLALTHVIAAVIVIPALAARLAE